ncbi:MAG: prepilin peptidase [Clostridia bacterium]|nr:prepilin peptidase [Clostridia bacterium]
MNLILYFAIFIIGSVFGSFFSLAVYRLPRKENITYVRSHCTSCNHRLNFLDLIPIWSYLFLGGKCRYCKEKIRPRYLLLEIFSGSVFLLIALSLHIKAFSTIGEFINLAFIYLFLCAVFIIGGIDNENFVIHSGTLLYGIIVSLVYILYQAIFLEKYVQYHLIGFLVIPIVMLLVSAALKKFLTNERLPWGFGDIKYIALIGLFMGFGLQVITIVLSVFIMFMMAFIKKQKRIPFGYYLSIACVIVLILSPQLAEYAELINLSFI